MSVKSYENDLEKNKPVTFSLLVGMIIAYILGNIYPLGK